MAEKYSIAQLDFRPVPSAQRQGARIKSVPARLYIDKFLEHRQAYEFIQEMQDLHGEGTKTVVRSLLHYRDSVIRPLEEKQAAGEETTQPELLIAQLDFRPVPQGQRKGSRIKHVAVRLYIDKYIEHRQAYTFVQEMQDIHGEGNKTIVRALIHYRDTIIAPMRAAEES